MKYDGMLQILRYNLPMYLAALTGCLAVALAVALLPLPRPLAILAALGATGAFLLSVTSLLASHYVYDLSPLSSWSWISGLFSTPPQRWASLHAGLDETFGALERLFPDGGTILDIYDPKEMTEPSIERARRLGLAPTAPADFRALPLTDASLDAVFLIFAAHELRQPESRLRLFNEIARSLAPGSSWSSTCGTWPTSWSSARASSTSWPGASGCAWRGNRASRYGARAGSPPS